MIFNMPQITKGKPVKEVVSSAPAKAGLNDDARLRGTAVTLAAAGRSGGVTTAMTYDVRVGTSICESAERTQQQSEHHEKVRRKSGKNQTETSKECA